jgi:CRP/FNR family transcriptional regulator, anaerobic regulatory protein
LQDYLTCIIIVDSRILRTVLFKSYHETRMDELFRFLNSISPLSEELRYNLLTVVKTRYLHKKETLLEAGQTSRSIYFIMKGVVRCYYRKNNREVTAWLMKEGDVIVSVESFYDQKPSYETIHALEDVELLYINHSELESLYRDFREFETIGRILTIKYLKFWNRQLFNLRMQSARERYEYLLANEAELAERVPSKYLASYVGMNEITFCRLRK